MTDVRLLLVLAVLAAGCAGTGRGQPRSQAASPAPGAQAPATDDFGELVALLGSPNFDVRMAAHEKLFARGGEIIPLLEEAAGKTADEDHRRQIGLLVADMRLPRAREEKKTLLLTLRVRDAPFELREPVAVELEVKNTGNVPLQLPVPLVRKRTVSFRLDWTADMTFFCEGREQVMVASGTNRDEWVEDTRAQALLALQPGESLKQEIDVTDLCGRPARYSAAATYRWAHVGDFASNAVAFEVKNPPAPEGGKGNGDN